MSEYIFEVKEEHIKLLKHSFVSWNDIEVGAASLDPKYPYGDSQLYNSMAEILNIPFENEDYEEFSSEHETYMDQLHMEIKAVLEIGIHTLLFSKGYYKKEDYDKKWQSISEDEYLELASKETTKNVHDILSEERY